MKELIQTTRPKFTLISYSMVKWNEQVFCLWPNIWMYNDAPIEGEDYAMQMEWIEEIFVRVFAVSNQANMLSDAFVSVW